MVNDVGTRKQFPDAFRADRRDRNSQTTISFLKSVLLQVYCSVLGGEDGYGSRLDLRMWKK